MEGFNSLRFKLLIILKQVKVSNGYSNLLRIIHDFQCKDIMSDMSDNVRHISSNL